MEDVLDVDYPRTCKSICLSYNKSRNLSVKYRELLLGLCSLYSIRIVRGTAVLGGNCSLHPAIGRYNICCRKFTVKCCMLAKFNK